MGFGLWLTLNFLPDTDVAAVEACPAPPRHAFPNVPKTPCVGSSVACPSAPAFVHVAPSLSPWTLSSQAAGPSLGSQGTCSTLRDSSGRGGLAPWFKWGARMVLTCRQPAAWPVPSCCGARLAGPVSQLPGPLSSAVSPTPLVHLSSRPGTLHDFHSHEIAEQLTLLDAELFYKIEVGCGAGWGGPFRSRAVRP